MKIYIFGNPLLEFDNLPIKLLPRLKKEFPSIEFELKDPTENFWPNKNGELFIIDSVEGINNVTIFSDADQIAIQSTYSLHDFDLGFNLKLLKKLGLLKKLTIFGVPMEGNEDEVFRELALAINRGAINRAPTCQT